MTRSIALGLPCLTIVLLLAATAPAAPLSREARFQAELEQIVEQYELPGATAAFTLADGTTEVVAAGLADVATGEPMRPASRMLAASIGKTFVAATVLALHQEGRLDLDDSLSSWLGHRDWFARLPNADTITLRQLLRHQSGLPDHVDDPAFHTAWQQHRTDGDAPLGPEDLIAFVLDHPPLFAAGQGWSYTDTGYLLLGLVIEGASGRSYYESVTDRFLEPLGLDATTPSDRTDLPGLATGYLSPDNPMSLPAETTVRPAVMAWDPRLEWTGGGLVSNPGDLTRWAWALFGGHALQEPYLETLLDAVPLDTTASGPRYGLGVLLRPEGPLGPTYGHAGWIPGYVSSLRYFPDEGIAVAFQVNTDIDMLGPAALVADDMELRLARIALQADDTRARTRRLDEPTLRRRP